MGYVITPVFLYYIFITRVSFIASYVSELVARLSASYAMHFAGILYYVVGTYRRYISKLITVRMVFTSVRVSALYILIPFALK